MDSLIGDEIGRGGFGVVYVKKDDPSACVKVSNKESNSCRKWSNEYKKIKSLLDKISDHSDYKKMKMIRIISPTEFVEDHKICYMSMPRVFRPEGRNVVKPTIQAQLGWPSSSLIHKGRGEFIGLKEIKEYIQTDDLQTACYELGVMMSLIHFVGKNDAYDMELYLGKEANSKKCRFYIADFDLSEEITKYDNGTYERLTWCFDAVPYFPRKSVDPELFEFFYKGYCKFGPIDVVEKIFEDYD